MHRIINKPYFRNTAVVILRYWDMFDYLLVSNANIFKLIQKIIA